MDVNVYEDSRKWKNLSREQKNYELFLKQKELLGLFLKHGAITQEQHDNSMRDLVEKMEIGSEKMTVDSVPLQREMQLQENGLPQQ